MYTNYKKEGINMRKKLFITIFVLILALGLSGCKKEKEVVETTPPTVEEPVIETDWDKKEVIMKDFQDLINSGKESEKVISYINDNIGKLTQIEGDKMIDMLEMKLEEGMEDLTNKIFATDKDDELMSIAGTESYFPEDKVADIKNSELKKEITTLFANMYRLVNLEGEFYPIVDYTKLKVYNDNISDEWKEYLSVRAMDSDEIPFSDGGIRINFKDLANRITKTENFLNKYIAGPRQKELLQLYESKLTAYMKGLPNTPITDNNNNISKDVMKSYEDTSNMEGYITAHMINQYLDDIKANNFAIDSKILASADRYIEEAVRMLREFK